MVIAGIFDDLLNAILTGLKDIFFWFVELVITAFASLLNSAIDLLPQIPATWGTVLNYAGYINYWIPVSEMLIIFNAYMAFVLAQTILKLGIKLFIPTVG